MIQILDYHPSGRSWNLIKSPQKVKGRVTADLTVEPFDTAVNPFDLRDLVVFDLDGTLIDSIGVWNEVDRRLRERRRRLPTSVFGSGQGFRQERGQT